VNQTKSAILSLLMLALLGSACAPATTPATTDTRGQASAARKQIVATIFSEPAGLHQEVTNPVPSAGSVPGVAELYTVLNGGLSYLDSDNVRHPWFEETLPSVDNGLWQVFPDGRMEVTWRLRPGIKWHDGTPLTADDLRFTLDVYRDKEIGAVVIPALALVDAMEVKDAQTAVMKWQKPFIDADALFSPASASSASSRVTTLWLMPKHLLEQPFQENKANFFGLPYWRESFVGTGPFKMLDWNPGNYAVLGANEAYVLGRPRLDQIEVRFFIDRGALKAALLAGAVHVPMGRGLTVDDVIQIRDRSDEVKVQLGGTLAGVLPIYPQFIDPDPPIVGNPQFRRALLMAIDRQELTDTLNNGLGPVAHSWVQADQPEGRAIDGRIVRYPYDPRAAAQRLEALGFVKGTEGVFQSSDGTKLSIGLLTHEQNSFHVPSALSVQTQWQRLGLDVQLDILPVARATDLRYRALFPSFILLSKGVISGPDGYFTRSQIPVQENNFAGGNAARYGSVELDGLIERYTRTIPFGERMGILGDIVQQQTDQVAMLPLFFQGGAFVLGSTRLKNVLSGQVWNANQWELD
jgi:peptide/nickel transport system substrate-binding protein